MSLKPDQETLAKEVLKKLPLFTGCNDVQIQALVEKLGMKELAAGKVAMMDQEINKTLYLLAKGKVSIWKRVSNEKKQLAVLEAPNFFGERSVFEDAPASALVKTDEACTFFTLERPPFEEVAQKFPALSEAVRNNMNVVRAQRLSPPVPEKSAD